MGGLGGPDSMKMGYLFGYEGWQITSGEERLGDVGSIDVKVIRMTGDSSSPDGQRVEDGVLGG